MHAQAMKWSYGREIEKFKLKATELAMLRAICWRFDTRLGYCPSLTDEELTVLTGYKARQGFTSARNHLRALNVLSFEHERRASDPKRSKYGKSNAYVYYVHMAECKPTKTEVKACPTAP